MLARSAAPVLCCRLLGPATAIGLAAGAVAQVQFVDVAGERGIGDYAAGPGYGTGVAAADFDDDGDVDLYVCNGPGVADQVYRNDGTGHFTDVAAELGLGLTGSSRSALWVDWSGDGRLDLVVGGDCFSDPVCSDRANTLHAYIQNEDGTFTDVSATVMPAEDGAFLFGHHRSGFSASDLDGDARLDLLVGTWGNGPPLLLHNEPDGAGGRRFVDRAAAAGLTSLDRDHWQPATFDANRDGRPDIMWAIDYTPNYLWINQGDLRFVDVAPTVGVDNAMNDMGMTLGDYDNDGDLDVYITEIFVFENHNVLFRNDTVENTVAFTEVAVAAGVENTGFGWGTVFVDADNDGWLDLAVTNGWFNGVGYDDPSRLFFNLGPGPDGVTFEDRGSAVGFDDTTWGSCLVAVDLENDGDRDLVQTINLGGPLRLLENRPDPPTAERHWLTVRPRGPLPNRYAIGAEVSVRAGTLTMLRPIEAGTSHLGQAPAEAAFGLGDAELVDELRIRWPDGAQTVRRNLDVDRIVTIERSPCPGTADLDGDGAIDFLDLLDLLSNWGPTLVARPQDVDGNGAVDGEDLAALVGMWGRCDR